MNSDSINKIIKNALNSKIIILSQIQIQLSNLLIHYIGLIIFLKFIKYLDLLL